MTSPLHNRVCDMLGIEHPIFAFAHHEDVIATQAPHGSQTTHRVHIREREAIHAVT